MKDKLFSELKKRYQIVEVLKSYAADGEPAERIEGRLVSVYNGKTPILIARATINDDGPENTSVEFGFDGAHYKKGIRPVESPIDEELMVMAEVIDDFINEWTSTNDGELIWDWLGD